MQLTRWLRQWFGRRATRPSGKPPEQILFNGNAVLTDGLTVWAEFHHDGTGFIELNPGTWQRSRKLKRLTPEQADFVRWSIADSISDDSVPAQECAP